jgi:hypothetical protein
LKYDQSPLARALEGRALDQPLAVPSFQYRLVSKNRLVNIDQLISRENSHDVSHESHGETSINGAVSYVWRQARRKMRVEHRPAAHRTSSGPAFGRFKQVNVDRLPSKYAKAREERRTHDDASIIPQP